jgi:hypothetical protein
MGNLIYSIDYASLDATATVCSAADTDYPSDNVTLITYPFRPWRPGAPLIYGQWIGLDLGSAKAIDAIVLDNMNFTSCKIQADAAATFDSGEGGEPEYDSGAITISKDPRDQRYKLFYAVDQTYRYWRCLVYTIGVVDDLGTASVGAMCALTTYVTLSANPGFPYDTTVKEPTINEGTGEPITLGHRYIQLDLASTNYDDALTFESDLLTLLHIGKAQPIVIYRNNANTCEVYIMYRVGDTRWSRSGPRHGRFSAISFRQASELLSG